MSTTTAVEKLKKLEAEVNDLRAAAKKEAMTAVTAALADLNSLGFKYRLTQDVPAKDGPFPRKSGRAKAKTGITRKRDPNAPCDVCGFATTPGHDGRKHRAQGRNKKAFTAAELESFGLKKK